jgi:hypothetical protein
LEGVRIADGRVGRPFIPLICDELMSSDNPLEFILLPLALVCVCEGQASGGTSSSGVVEFVAITGVKFKICPSWSSSSSELTAFLCASSESSELADPDDSFRVMSGGVDVIAAAVSMSCSSPLASSDEENGGDALSMSCAGGGVAGRGVSLKRTPLAEPGSAVMTTPSYINLFFPTPASLLL